MLGFKVAVGGHIGIGTLIATGRDSTWHVPIRRKRPNYPVLRSTLKPEKSAPRIVVGRRAPAQLASSPS